MEISAFPSLSLLRVVIVIFLSMCCSTARATKINHLRSVHESQLRQVMHYINQSKCRHIYYDLGSNVGVQIRKLYEPELFPKASVLPYFRKYFLNASVAPNNTFGGVCAIGFEANGVHTDYLLKLNRHFQQRGYPAVVFTDAAVNNRSGTVTFFEDKGSEKDRHEWGASVYMRPQLKMNSNFSFTALSVDISHFMQKVFHLWQRRNFNSITSKVLAKMDIEGSEFYVLPYMIEKKTLCLVNLIMIEWHHDIAHKLKIGVNATKDRISDWTRQNKDCQFELKDLDDESYGQSILNFTF